MTPVSTTVTGPARVDASPRVLARRLQPGDIAIIDAVDLDRRSAAALAARRPAAVVNAQPFLSGRIPTTGARLLLESGIVVVDHAGDESLAIRDGAAVTVDGGLVSVDGRPLGGTVLSLDDVDGRIRAADADLGVHVSSLTATALDLLRRDAPLLLDGAGVPELRVPVEGRPVVIVTPRFDGDDAVARFARERRPVVIAVGEGADAARAARLQPRVVMGDIDTVAEEALRHADQVIVHDPAGRDAGRRRAQAIGLTHDSCDTGLASEDLAILAAHAAGASVVVLAGGRDGLVDFVEDRSTSGAGALLARLAAGGVLVDAAVLPEVYRPRYSAWTAWGALGLGLVATVLALWGTAEVNQAIEDGWRWLVDTVEGLR